MSLNIILYVYELLVYPLKENICFSFLLFLLYYKLYPCSNSKRHKFIIFLRSEVWNESQSEVQVSIRSWFLWSYWRILGRIHFFAFFAASRIDIEHGIFIFAHKIFICMYYTETFIFCIAITNNTFVFYMAWH